MTGYAMYEAPEFKFGSWYLPTTRGSSIGVDEAEYLRKAYAH